MDLETNVIYCGDCLKKLKDIPDESVELIYIDTPFSSDRDYVAFWKEQEKRHFEDRFENVQAYIEYMRPRVKELYRVLKQKGSFYYHCDWHASHYIKVMLDRDDLFGYSNFRNEIIWKRAFAHNDPNKYGHLHDTLLFYTKSKKWTWNKVMIPYSAEYIEKYYRYNDKSGRSFLSRSLTAPGGRGPKYEWKGITRNWRVTKENMEKLEKEDKIFYTKNGIPRYKQYAEEIKGMSLQSIWTDILPIVTWTKENLGYPTQKPSALLERVINSSSNEGDIVLDAFCGCGTSIVEAQKLKRKWIGIDISPTACRVMGNRLESLGLKIGKDFTIKDMPKTVEELRGYPAFEFQNWVINALGGVPNKIRVRDMGIDGKLYPIEDVKKEKKEDRDMFGVIDNYIPIQVKRTDQIGRPEIDSFESAMKRDKRNKGIVIGFDFSRDALKEIRRVEREDGLLIEPKTVKQIVEDQLDKSLLESV